MTFLTILFIIAVLLVLAQLPIIGFYVRAFYYGMCLMIGGFAGGIASIPSGKSTNNHFRMFKIFQAMTWPMGIKFELRNGDILNDEKPYIIIANHQSALDVLGMSYAWPVNCVVMLKSSLKYFPGFNLCAYLCESVYINRFSKEKAHKTVDSTLSEIVTKKRKVWIYPEGTRNPEPELLPFKKGAFILAKEAKIPIVPCVFSSHKYFYNNAEKRLTGGHCIIDILPEVDSSKFDSVDELSAHCRKIMQCHREKLDAEAANLNR
ncbi:CBN-ACL-1 protein [Caenorhabditis brenneri]|uniref:1-acyl-sn-glycerol-3-phosphate acyltransferase n=1 Tax=Caenorhabditis brenneri TaxID=135651 RepID=G0MH33_CAEBE|nr:CBN-ACL-1 protein [Caenorhabditis brenneri]